MKTATIKVLKNHISFAIILMLILTCSAFADVQAQLVPKQIAMKKTLLGYSLHQGPMQVGRNKMRVLLKDQPQSLSQFNSGNNTLAVSILMQMLALVSIGGYASERFFNDRIRNELLVAGGAALGLSIPINLGSKQKISTAIAKYNIGIQRKKQIKRSLKD